MKKNLIYALVFAASIPMVSSAYARDLGTIVTPTTVKATQSADQHKMAVDSKAQNSMDDEIISEAYFFMSPDLVSLAGTIDDVSPASNEFILIAPDGSMMTLVVDENSLISMSSDMQNPQNFKNSSIRELKKGQKAHCRAEHKGKDYQAYLVDAYAW